MVAELSKLLRVRGALQANPVIFFFLTQVYGMDTVGPEGPETFGSDGNVET